MSYVSQPGLPLALRERAPVAPLPIDAHFDESFADALARLETYNKHYYRPNSYLHKWWARRCGSTFRLILKGLVTAPEAQDYYAPGGLAGAVILDPMMGGGTTVHEAIRMGANVIGADIDPIPILQARASLADTSLSSLEDAFADFHGRLASQLAPLLATCCPRCRQATPLRFTLYGLRRFCDCGPVIVVDSLTLRQERDGWHTVLCPTCHRVQRRQGTSARPNCDCALEDGRPTLVPRRQRGCPQCDQRYLDHLDIPFYGRYVPLALAADCPEHGFFVQAPTSADVALIAQADARRAALNRQQAADFAVGDGPKSKALGRRGVGSYLDLFSSRQLLYLHEAITCLPALAPALRLNLALLVSTSLEFNSLLCGYKGTGKRRAGAIRHVFSLHAYSFPYTAVENNPVHPDKISGSLQKLFHDRIRRARRWARLPKERRLPAEGRPQKVALKAELDLGQEVQQVAQLQTGSRRFLLCHGSSARLDLPDGCVDFVVTDPPYFDSVQYSDLATFFRVWLRRLLPGGASWEVDLAQSAVEPQANGDDQYTPLISAIFSECHRVLRKEHGRFIFTFHHWNPKGWAAISRALKQAGFVLVNRYVVHSENLRSVHIAPHKALLHDAILVLAAAESGVAGQWARPQQIDKGDGRQFCHDCATLLGWILQTRPEDGAIDEIWRRHLRRS
jgi:putative DNA methylase